MEKEFNFKHELLELLALIHGDGGHYVIKNGLKKAVNDAKEIIYKSKSYK